jgi:hypothetical protein
VRRRGKREQKYPFLLYLSHSFDHWRDTVRERPKHLLKSKILTIINLLMNTEKYIAIKNQKFEKFKERCKPFL